MATFSLSQETAEVEQLGNDVYDDTKGHNTLTADISGSDLNRAWVEMSLDGGAWEDMRHATAADYKDAIGRTPDGTAISNISIRESVDIRYESDEQDTLLLFWGNNAGDTLYKATSADDPTAFSGATQIHSDTSDQAEDPNLYLDRTDYTLHLLYENSGSPNTVAVYDADTPSGENYGNKSVIGATHWSLGISFASPLVWVYNNQLYISGEEHDTTDRDLMVAKGDKVRDWKEYQIVAESANYSDISDHINLQGVYIDRYGTLHGYSNQHLSNGNWASRYMGTETWSDGYPVAPWDMGTAHADQNVGAILRLFNEQYVYAHDPSTNDALHYWHVPGQRIEDTLSASGGTVSFEWYEPTLPQGSDISWRIVAEHGDGTTERSTTMSFDVVRPSAELSSVRAIDSIHVRDNDGLWPIDIVQTHDGWELNTSDIEVRAQR